VYERIAAYRAEEFEDRLMAMSSSVRVQAQKLPSETGPIIGKLDQSATTISLAAEQLSSIDLDKLVGRPMREAADEIEHRGMSSAPKAEKRAAQAVARSMKEQMALVRPQLVALKAEAPRVEFEAKRLERIHLKFDGNAERVTKAYQDFETAIHGDPKLRIAAAARQSIVIPLLIAVLITGIALSGVFLNFFLIQRPMAEIVGDGSKIGGIGLPTFAAMIVIFLEFVAGVVLMDAAGFTKLIPNFNAMSDTSRRIMFWVAFVFLVMFCALEIMLATVREQIIENEQATRELASSIFTAAPGANVDTATAAAAAAADVAAPAPTDGLAPVAEPAAMAAPAPAGPSPMLVMILGGLTLLVMAATALMGERLGEMGRKIGMGVAASCVVALCGVVLFNTPALSPSSEKMSTITMAQIILAGLIPWLLATAALPLETIIRNSVFLWHILWANVLIIFGSVFKAIGETMEHGFHSIHSSPPDEFAQKREAKRAAREAAEARRAEEAVEVKPRKADKRASKEEAALEAELARKAS
jgi:hypothetical protein